VQHVTKAFDYLEVHFKPNEFAWLRVEPGLPVVEVQTAIQLEHKAHHQDITVLSLAKELACG